MRVSVIGSGYVGLVAGACLAHVGHQVAVVERNPARVARLHAGEVPLHEAGLGELLAEGARTGRLRVTTTLTLAPVVLVAVGTPSGPDGAPDLTALHAAVDQLVAAAEGPLVLVVKSTVPVGTHARLAARLPAPIALVSNPEFLREGRAVRDFLDPARIVLGGPAAAVARVRELYAPLGLPDDRILAMDGPSAELTKLGSNAMIALRVALVNELARLADATGANMDAVRSGIGADPRIGHEVLRPSPGFGGSCLPKDLRGLVHAGASAGVPLPLAAAALHSNAAQLDHIMARVEHALGGLVGRRVAVWGLAFKAGTDDVRESAAVALVERLLTGGAVVAVHDPAAMSTARALLGDRVQWSTDPVAAADGADAVLIATEWPEYRAVDLAHVLDRMRGDLVYDARNLLPAADDAYDGARYRSLGRPAG
ncbi:MAG: UDPglucose 6-dehydrogenase [Myxococcota bacterium]